MSAKIFLLIICLFSGLALSQTTVSGIVTGSDRKALAGVNVILKDTYHGATTDLTGRFSFSTVATGHQTLQFLGEGYKPFSEQVMLTGQAINLNIRLTPEFNEIEGITLNSESITSLGNSTKTLLQPLDFSTTPGGEQQMTKTLGFLPGVQRVGDKDGMFVRGGTASETKIFINGNLVNNYFYNSVAGIPGRDRFNANIFKRSNFSRGAYSAAYGQAMSSILTLETLDFPEKTSANLMLLPFLYTAGYQQVNPKKTFSFGGEATLTEMNWFTKAMNYQTDFNTGPKSVHSDFNFSLKTKGGGILKYYGSYDQNRVEILSPDGNDNTLTISQKGNNTYHNLYYKKDFGRTKLTTGVALSFNHNNVGLHSGSDVSTKIQNKGSYVNFKTTLETKLSPNFLLNTGFEFQNTLENNHFSTFQNDDITTEYKNLLSAAFIESTWRATSKLFLTTGLRFENSTWLKKSDLAPRITLGYHLPDDWESFLSYGIFYQNPDSKYLSRQIPLNYQQADQYVLQIQKITADYNFRLEAFYKNYKNLLKTNLIGTEYLYDIQNATATSGTGCARGFELFWRDRKTFKTVDYWISYSYLDTKRDFLDYPALLFPTFASKHTLSVVAKKFFLPLKTQINLTYTFATGRPYYHIAMINGESVLREHGFLPDYNSLNMSINYVPFVGKRNPKNTSIFFLSISNLLGYKNVFDYNFLPSGQRLPVLPVVNTTIYVGAIFNFGIDRTKDILENDF